MSVVLWPMSIARFCTSPRSPPISPAASGTNEITFAIPALNWLPINSAAAPVPTIGSVRRLDIDDPTFDICEPKF